MAETPLLEVKHLKKHFPIKGGVFSKTIGYVYAVDDINFTLSKGETLGLVGESGCGKSTTGRTILRLIEPTAGAISFEGQDITTLDKSAMRALRREMQIIFQDPYASLNPRMTVGQMLAEPLALHGLARGREKARVAELLALVGLAPEHARRHVLVQVGFDALRGIAGLAETRYPVVGVHAHPDEVRKFPQPQRFQSSDLHITFPSLRRRTL